MVTRTRQPTIPLTEIEHAAFCKPEDELPAKSLAEELAINVRWQKIPGEYLACSPAELDERIGAARRTLGDSVTILGHHYQREEIIKYADFQGDSFLLSQEAASRPEADYIIFCGVHFMAETACILAGEHQQVILPNITAGCSMADMAPIQDVEDGWEDLQDVLGDHGGILPVTYMNSVAAIKALCGRNGGAVCTSSNATAVLEWAFGDADRVLFLPDQHLGRNTALKLGIPWMRWWFGTPSKPWAATRRSNCGKPRWCFGKATAPCIPGSQRGRSSLPVSGTLTSPCWCIPSAPWKPSRPPI